MGQFVDAFNTHTENWSDALIKMPTMEVPNAVTAMSVMRLCTRSRPGSARFSQAMRMPPMITDNTATAPRIHHSEDWMKNAAPPTPCGPPLLTS
ncbi:hypothetical protein ACFPRL_35545 [Pseudoclavibacter helvolus]